jgi:hypothetical protein
MKKSILLIALLISTSFIYAQQIPVKDVPLNVQEQVKGPFPEVKSGKYPVKWEKVGPNYKATLFATSSTPAICLIDTLANLIRVEHSVAFENVNPKAKEILKAKYKDFEITETYQIMTKTYVVYRVKLIVKPVYVFDNDGQVVDPKDPKYPK